MAKRKKILSRLSPKQKAQFLKMRNRKAKSIWSFDLPHEKRAKVFPKFQSGAISSDWPNLTRAEKEKIRKRYEHDILKMFRGF